jgi:hypothetical protein
MGRVNCKIQRVFSGKWLTAILCLVVRFPKTDQIFEQVILIRLSGVV